MRSGLPILLLCLAWAGEVPAQVFKWVDANGVTHYGEQAPANQKAKEVKLREATPRSRADAGPAAYSANLKDKEQDLRQRREEREQEESRRVAAKAHNEAACRGARAQLHDLRSTPKLYDVNERGERVYLGDAERGERLAKREAEYNRHCG